MTHRFSFLPLLALCAAGSLAQSPARATRADGSAVILFPNGTWRPDSTAGVTKPKGSGESFTTPAASTSSLDLGRGVTLHYKPAKWSLAPGTGGGRAQLRHVDGDGYGMTISERIQMPLATLKNVVLSNARTAAPDLKVTLDEKRTVNGLDIQVLQFEGTAQGIPFHWYGYYYTGKGGTIQVITFAGASLFDGFKTDFEDLLNGLQAVDQ
jgi:hypothetical protein